MPMLIGISNPQIPTTNLQRCSKVSGSETTRIMNFVNDNKNLKVTVSNVHTSVFFTAQKFTVN
ncbi:CLUMA_CG014159, isoform A [Clunio marinus]|uniref:CLUMA_CG014159, isoform A n=1 Tax=Clunio marinus TaxID=568069 RepID=A0A1J1IKY7_9DIPT|nr:CLUMA_CG014159, isoform A [Clunio marinus]